MHILLSNVLKSNWKSWDILKSPKSMWIFSWHAIFPLGGFGKVTWHKTINCQLVFESSLTFPRHPHGHPSSQGRKTSVESLEGRNVSQEYWHWCHRLVCLARCCSISRGTFFTVLRDLMKRSSVYYWTASRFDLVWCALVSGSGISSLFFLYFLFTVLLSHHPQRAKVKRKILKKKKTLIGKARWIVQLFDIRSTWCFFTICNRLFQEHQNSVGNQITSILFILFIYTYTSVHSK